MLEKTKPAYFCRLGSAEMIFCGNSVSFEQFEISLLMMQAFLFRIFRAFEVFFSFFPVRFSI